MDKDIIAMNPNPLVAALQKPAREFTKADIISYIRNHDIRMVNFMYPGGDGRLKTLSFVINSMRHLDDILSCGERVDGSSLFNFIQADSSDLYVLPRFSTAFINPFTEIPTLCMLCSYFDKDGQPLASAPEHTLIKAAETFRRVTGMEFQAMGELEYYVVRPYTRLTTDYYYGEFPQNDAYPATDQHGYHESSPFAKVGDLRMKCMQYISQAGGQIKYGHSEVGNFTLENKCEYSDYRNRSLGSYVYEQNEIEFLPVDVVEAADQLMIAKWVIRNQAFVDGFNVTFAPKITAGKAGSGLHIHMRMMENGHNRMLSGGVLSDEARRAIAGMIDVAGSITAFGNKNPTSYFRLVPHQEAPTNICWGDRNRSVLIRVPLGWTANTDMCHIANPQEPPQTIDTTQKQTVEMRSPDGSADIYQLLAGLCVACRHGFEMEKALDVAAKTYVDVNIHDEANAARQAQLATLPDSCVASAACLERQRSVFEKYGVFSPAAIDGIISQLRAFDDADLRSRLEGDKKATEELVQRFFHCG